ncbi:MAG: hypothetical protein SGPRY_010786 [Prymnesium sp.]
MRLHPSILCSFAFFALSATRVVAQSSPNNGLPVHNITCALRPSSCTAKREGAYFAYRENAWADLVDRNTLFPVSNDYFVYGHDNTYATWFTFSLLSLQASIASVLLSLCCFRCCFFRTTHLACRALAALSRFAFAIAYFLAFVHHQRLNFGNLAESSDRTAVTELGGLGPLPNSCFFTSDLMWGAMTLYSHHGFLAIGSGLHLAACSCLFIRHHRRRAIFFSTAFLIAGLGGAVATALKLYGFPVSFESIRTAQSMIFTIGTGIASSFVTPVAMRNGYLHRKLAAAIGAKLPDVNPSTPKIPKSVGCGAPFFSVASMLFGVVSLIQDMLFDGLKFISSFNCGTPCPDSCPLSHSFNHNALANTIMLVGWFCLDLSIHLLLPLAEDGYSLVSHRSKVAPNPSESDPEAAFVRQSRDSQGDGEEEGSFVEDDLTTEDVDDEEAGDANGEEYEEDDEKSRQ